MLENIEQVKRKYPSMMSGFMSRVHAYVEVKFIEMINQHQVELEKLEQQCLMQWNALYQERPGLILQAVTDINRYQL